ncbi:MAG TPA: helix-turn-helix transcriptional regulator [Clostridia bacterium]|nr:helix-turn-helix transcriptional regulator [Clostridia bacterium]
MSIYFKENFKFLRKKRDLTQEQIADKFHVAPQSVSRWETGAITFHG